MRPETRPEPGQTRAGIALDSTSRRKSQVGNWSRYSTFTRRETVGEVELELTTASKGGNRWKTTELRSEDLKERYGGPRFLVKDN